MPKTATNWPAIIAQIDGMRAADPLLTDKAACAQLVAAGDLPDSPHVHRTLSKWRVRARTPAARPVVAYRKGHNAQFIDWEPVVKRAAEIVAGYTTGVTLRQLFYRLVAAQVLPNTQGAYDSLSHRTAEARRDGWFPDLIDLTRQVHENQWFKSARDAKTWLADIYRRDRSEGQDWSVYLGVEKHGQVELLKSWFGEYGLPILSLGGNPSQTYVDAIRDHVRDQKRQAVLLYAGDFDASGLFIERDLHNRAACFDKYQRVALTLDQVRKYNLPENPAKERDNNLPAFIAETGVSMQVEMDALPPETLRQLFASALAPYWDDKAHKRALRLEARDIKSLKQ